MGSYCLLFDHTMTVIPHLEPSGVHSFGPKKFWQRLSCNYNIINATLSVANRTTNAKNVTIIPLS